MANIIILRRQNDKVFASRLEGEVEEFIEDGDAHNEFLGNENWSQWKETNWHLFDWRLLEEELGLPSRAKEENMEAGRIATLIVAWITDEGKFDSVILAGACAVLVEEKDEGVIVTYKVYNKGDEEKMVFPNKKFPGLVVDHGIKRLFHRNSEEIK